MRHLTRRQVLLTGATIALPACGGTVSPGATDATDAAGEPDASDAGAPDVPADAADAQPAPTAWPGRVIDVGHSGAVIGGTVQNAALAPMFARGMMELTGAVSEVAAWQTLFAPTDVVAIKVNPFGWPKVYTQPATVAEIVRGLGLAGVPPKNVIVYDRYGDYLAQVGYDAALPSGVRLMSAALTTSDQTALAGHDPSTFVEFAAVDTGLDPNVAQNRRSYLCDVVSNQVTKVINVPVLKSHWTAGFTAALKNMTYGLVNNTARTHTATSNWTMDFLPVVAGIPRLRQKTVLHVADMLFVCWDGGPDPSDSFVARESFVFATDPVALDTVAWKLIDDLRAGKNLGPVASMPGATPQYVLRAGANGLGVSELAKIDHRLITV